MFVSAGHSAKPMGILYVLEKMVLKNGCSDKHLLFYGLYYILFHHRTGEIMVYANSSSGNPSNIKKDGDLKSTE